MSLIRILVDSFADKQQTNAQMTNARDIVQRMDPERFHVSMFYVTEPDPLVVQRPNTRLIALPAHRQTPRILREFILGPHHLLFYLKSSPASKWYLRLRRLWRDSRPVVGTVESVLLASEMSRLPREAVSLWEQSILRCDHLYSNASSVKETLMRTYGLQSGVVATGVDTGFFCPAERPMNPRVKVLFAGSVRDYKEPQTVVEAAAKFPEADFIIAGDGNMASELRERAERERLENLRFTGPLCREALREQYRQADIFFFPSHWEGSPKVVMEAAACGLPVIVRNDYEPESVIDGKTGYVAASTEELFARLAELMQRPDLRRDFGKAGRELMGRFDWGPITRQWEEIFLQLTANAVKNTRREPSDADSK